MTVMSSKKQPPNKKPPKKNKPTATPKHPASFKLPIPRLRRISLIVTGAHLIAVLIAFFGSDGIRNAVALGCSAVFMVGAVLFAWAFTIAAGRSRAEDVTVAGAFFLAGSVEQPERRWAFGFLAAQTVIGFAGAAADPYTTMAFSVLVPMFGLGIVAFLGSAHGSFRQRKTTK